MRAATPSPMSSRAIVAESLIQRLAVQATNRIETTAAVAAAAANGRQLSVPSPVTTIVRGVSVSAGFCCTGRAYAAGLLTLAP